MVAAGRLGRKTGRGYYDYERRPRTGRRDPSRRRRAGGGDGRLVVIAGETAARRRAARAAADAGGLRRRATPSDAAGEVPWLIVDCGAERDERAARCRAARVAVLCADGSLAALDPGGGAVGFHALPPLEDCAPGRADARRTAPPPRPRSAPSASSRRSASHVAWVGDAPGLVLGRIVVPARQRGRVRARRGRRRARRRRRRHGARAQPPARAAGVGRPRSASTTCSRCSTGCARRVPRGALPRRAAPAPAACARAPRRHDGRRGFHADDDEASCVRRPRPHDRAARALDPIRPWPCRPSSASSTTTATPSGATCVASVGPRDGRRLLPGDVPGGAAGLSAPARRLENLRGLGADDRPPQGARPPPRPGARGPCRSAPCPDRRRPATRRACGSTGALWARVRDAAAQAARRPSCCATPATSPTPRSRAALGCVRGGRAPLGARGPQEAARGAGRMTTDDRARRAAAATAAGRHRRPRAGTPRWGSRPGRRAGGRRRAAARFAADARRRLVRVERRPLGTARGRRPPARARAPGLRRPRRRPRRRARRRRRAPLAAACSRRPARLDAVRRELDEYFAGPADDVRPRRRLGAGHAASRRRVLRRHRRRSRSASVAPTREVAARGRQPARLARRRQRARRQPDADRRALPPRPAHRRRPRRLHRRPGPQALPAASSRACCRG